MISEIDAEVWLDYNESVQGMHQLEQFSKQWQSSNKIEDVWRSFRLLHLQPAYLIASHYHYEQFGWLLKTKWNLYTEFDKKLHRKDQPHKIASSIDSALQTQRKIVSLQKIFATLQDSSKTLKDKANVYQDLKKENGELYQDILHKIWVAKGKSSTRKEVELEISQQPDGPYSKGVVNKMLYLYNEGHPTLEDYFFETPVLRQ